MDSRAHDGLRENPVLVVSGDSSVVLIGREQVATNQFRFYGWTGITSNNASVASFVAYVFDRASVVGQQKYLIINDSNGTLVFDASCKYMKVVGVIDTLNGINSLAVPSGKVYGTMLGGTGGKMIATAASHGSEVN